MSAMTRMVSSCLAEAGWVASLPEAKRTRWPAAREFNPHTMRLRPACCADRGDWVRLRSALALTSGELVDCGTVLPVVAVDQGGRTLTLRLSDKTLVARVPITICDRVEG